MFRNHHNRMALALLVLAVLLLPMLAVFAAAGVRQHGCCSDPADAGDPARPEQCCFLRSNPAPAQVAMAPVRTASHEHALVPVSRIAIAPDTTPGYVAVSEFASSPPVGPNCSSILRI